MASWSSTVLRRAIMSRMNFMVRVLALPTSSEDQLFAEEVKNVIFNQQTSKIFELFQTLHVQDSG